MMRLLLIVCRQQKGYYPKKQLSNKHLANYYHQLFPLTISKTIYILPFLFVMQYFDPKQQIKMMVNYNYLKKFTLSPNLWWWWWWWRICMLAEAINDETWWWWKYLLLMIFFLLAKSCTNRKERRFKVVLQASETFSFINIQLTIYHSWFTLEK